MRRREKGEREGGREGGREGEGGKGKERIRREERCGGEGEGEGVPYLKVSLT